MLKQSVLRELIAIVGAANCSVAPEELVAYSYDATRREATPQAVVRPATAEETSKVLLLADRERIAVVPRGAGTGMSGGAVPVGGGIVLSLERMARILEINEEDMIAVTEPGVTTRDFQRAVEARGLFYPPDPASSAFCTMGGNVAECAGGLRAVKYGVTKDYVIGLDVVLATGELITTGGRTAKNVVGYDLTKLIVGSEGTLGVVTKIVVKLLPLPESVCALAAFFSSIDAAAKTASLIMKSRLTPRALELIGPAALRVAERYLKEDLSGGATAMLLVEVDGSAAATERDAERIADIMTGAGASRLSRASSSEDREALWRARRCLSPALYAVKPVKVNEDIVVPRSRIADILHEIDAVAERYGLLIVNFGHAGDGNIHTNIMIEDNEKPKAEAAVREIFAATLRMGGSISGEHGIGVSKAPYLAMELRRETIAAMMKIKQALDPNNILNPGKIFPNAE
jgi:glycolate oxidase